MQPPDEWNNQEPMRRRRRKRKRNRPQQQQEQQTQPLDEDDMKNYWQSAVDDEQDQENGGIIVSVNGVKGIQNVNTEVWHDENDRSRNSYPIRNEFVQEMVMRVQGPGDNSRQEVRSKSYRKSYAVAKKEGDLNGAINGDGSASDLKNLLKHSGGLSLSEILQEQNLSLDDLLKGKQNAFKVLQNTAAPPLAESNLSNKEVRRIPSVKRPVSLTEDVTSERPLQRNNFQVSRNDNSKQTRRLPNFSRTKADPVVTSPTVIEDHRKELVGTMSSFLVPPKSTDDSNLGTTDKTNTDETVTIANANIRGLSGNRRLPTSSAGERTKPIKEIVSKIRPDLSNSNSRRRLLPIKLRGNLGANTTTSTNIRQEPKERLPPRYGSGHRLTSTESVNTTQSSDELLRISKESSTIAVEVIYISTTSATTTTTTTSSSSTTSPPTTQGSKDVVKDIVKSRLALKPRLRLPHISSNPTTTSTTTEPSVDVNAAEPTETISPEELTSSESSDDITTVSSETDLAEDEEDKYSFSSDEELKEFLDKSEPQINSILEEFALYNGKKSVVPIEDLFEETLSGDQEDLHIFTSRSDKMAVTDKSNEINKNNQNLYQLENPKMPNGKVDVTERNPSLFSDITSVRSTDDKTDILELLDDRRGGARLVKVLEQRNMTLEELLEHRQRGSSQLHLSEIIHNKTKPLIDVYATDKLDIVTAFENFPNFNLPNVRSVKPDDVRIDSEGSSYFSEIINIKPTDEIYKEGRSLKGDPFIKPISPTVNFPQWKSVHYPSQDVNYVDASKRDIVSSSRLSPHDDQMEQIESEVARSHDFVDLELSGHGFKPNSVTVETAQIPVGVRSAIIASASIVGISLMIFILIFATCRWRQKQRKKLKYSENFQTVRGRLPILTRNTTSSSSTKRSSSPNIFTTTGSRSSKLNTMDPNSPEVQEYLYDAMRKSFR